MLTIELHFEHRMTIFQLLNNENVLTIISFGTLHKHVSLLSSTDLMNNDEGKWLDLIQL